MVLALAQALIDHPQRTLDAVEISAVISQTLAREALAAEQARRAQTTLADRGLAGASCLRIISSQATSCWPRRLLWKPTSGARWRWRITLRPDNSTTMISTSRRDALRLTRADRSSPSPGYGRDGLAFAHQSHPVEAAICSTDF